MTRSPKPTAVFVRNMADPESRAIWQEMKNRNERFEALAPDWLKNWSKNQSQPCGRDVQTDPAELPDIDSILNENKK